MPLTLLGGREWAWRVRVESVGARAREKAGKTTLSFPSHLSIYLSSRTGVESTTLSCGERGRAKIDHARTLNSNDSWSGCSECCHSAGWPPLIYQRLRSSVGKDPLRSITFVQCNPFNRLLDNGLIWLLIQVLISPIWVLLKKNMLVIWLRF